MAAAHTYPPGQLLPPAMTSTSPASHDPNINKPSTLVLRNLGPPLSIIPPVAVQTAPTASPILPLWRTTFQTPQPDEVMGAAQRAVIPSAGVSGNESVGSGQGGANAASGQGGAHAANRGASEAAATMYANDTSRTPPLAQSPLPPASTSTSTPLPVPQPQASSSVATPLPRPSSKPNPDNATVKQPSPPPPATTNLPSVPPADAVSTLSEPPATSSPADHMQPPTLPACNPTHTILAAFLHDAKRANEYSASPSRESSAGSLPPPSPSHPPAHVAPPVALACASSHSPPTESSSTEAAHPCSTGRDSTEVDDSLAEANGWINGHPSGGDPSGGDDPMAEESVAPAVGDPPSGSLDSNDVRHTPAPPAVSLATEQDKSEGSSCSSSSNDPSQNAPLPTSFSSQPIPGPSSDMDIVTPSTTAGNRGDPITGSSAGALPLAPHKTSSQPTAEISPQPASQVATELPSQSQPSDDNDIVDLTADSPPAIPVVNSDASPPQQPPAGPLSADTQPARPAFAPSLPTAIISPTLPTATATNYSMWPTQLPTARTPAALMVQTRVPNASPPYSSYSPARVIPQAHAQHGLGQARQGEQQQRQQQAQQAQHVQQAHLAQQNQQVHPSQPATFAQPQTQAQSQVQQAQQAFAQQSANTTAARSINITPSALGQLPPPQPAQFPVDQPPQQQQHPVIIQQRPSPRTVTQLAQVPVSPQAGAVGQQSRSVFAQHQQQPAHPQPQVQQTCASPQMGLVTQLSLSAAQAPFHTVFNVGPIVSAINTYNTEGDSICEFRQQLEHDIEAQNANAVQKLFNAITAEADTQLKAQSSRHSQELQLLKESHARERAILAHNLSEQAAKVARLEAWANPPTEGFEQQDDEKEILKKENDNLRREVEVKTLHCHNYRTEARDLETEKSALQARYDSLVQNHDKCQERSRKSNQMMGTIKKENDERIATVKAEAEARARDELSTLKRAHDRELDRLKRQLQDKTNEIGAVSDGNNQLDAVKKQLAALEAELATTKSELATTESELATTKSELATATVHAKDTETERERAAQNLDHLREVAEVIEQTAAEAEIPREELVASTQALPSDIVIKTIVLLDKVIQRHKDKHDRLVRRFNKLTDTASTTLTPGPASQSLTRSTRGALPRPPPGLKRTTTSQSASERTATPGYTAVRTPGSQSAAAARINAAAELQGLPPHSVCNVKRQLEESPASSSMGTPTKRSRVDRDSVTLEESAEAWCRRKLNTYAKRLAPGQPRNCDMCQIEYRGRQKKLGNSVAKEEAPLFPLDAGMNDDAAVAHLLTHSKTISSFRKRN